MQTTLSNELTSLQASFRRIETTTFVKVDALIQICIAKQKDIDGLEGKVSNLEEKITSLTAENEKLKQQNIRVKKSKDALLDEFTELNVKYTELLGSDRDTAKLIDKQIALQSEIASLKAKSDTASSMDSERAALHEAEMNKLCKENKKLNAKVASLTKECTKLEEQKLQGDKAMKEELVSWRTRYSTLNEEMQRLKDQSLIREVTRKKIVKRFMAILEHKNVEDAICRETEAKKVAEMLENVTIKTTGDSNFELDVVAFQNLLAAFMVRHTTILQDLRKQYDALIRLTVQKLLCAQAANSLDGDGINVALEFTHPDALYLFDV